MKNLANCTPREFLRQTNRIRRAAERWLDLTRLNELRRPLPDETDFDDPRALKAAVERQIRENARAMLDAMLEDHPEETAELLGLMCFIEPEDLEKHRMSELLESLGELLASREVAGFFMSLARWARPGI